MKKIAFCLVALFAMILASCSNDDIEITQTSGLKIYVSTENLYDQFDITSDIKGFIRDEDYVRVMTFLYNKDGNLVASKQEDLKQLNTVTFDFNNVPDGEYTALTIETFVEKNKNGIVESPAWSFDDVDKLSTIKATQKWHEVYFPYVIGVSTTQISLKDNAERTVVPRGIGSLLQLYFLNFDQSSYVDVGFATDDVIDYYSFNPNLGRDSRFHTDQTSKGYTNVRCSTEIEKESNIRCTRYVLEKSISYDFCFTKDATNSNKGTWTYWTSLHGNATLEDGKTYYGGARFNGDDEPLDTYFGDLDGFKSWYSRMTQTTQTLIPSLYTTWKSSVSSVQSFMADYSMTVGKSGQAIKQDDGSYGLAYKGKGKETQILYFFTSARTGLFETDVLYLQKNVSKTGLMKELNEKYTFVASENETYMYQTKDAKTYVLLFPHGDDNEYWMLGYVDVDHVSNNGTSSLRMPAQAKRLLKSKIH